METGVTPLRSRSSRRVPITATAAMIKGVAAETSEPKTKNKRSNVKGKAISTACSRSCSTTVSTS